MASEADRLRCALYGARAALVVPEGTADGWGLGFYQTNEVLLQKRPRAPVGAVDLYALLRELRADVILGHARAAGSRPDSADTKAAGRSENTPPFRFRSGLFASVAEDRAGVLSDGAIANSAAAAAVRAALLERVPDFLRRNVRGDTASERLFHVLLTALRDAGKLEEPRAGDVRDAIVKTLAALDEVCARTDLPPPALALAVTNGQTMIAVSRGTPLVLREVAGITDCPVCREPETAGRRPRPVNHEHLRSVLLLSRTPEAATPSAELEGFRLVPANSVVTVGSDLVLGIEPLARA
jgi:glutamine amidotransferase